MGPRQQFYNKNIIIPEANNSLEKRQDCLTNNTSSDRKKVHFLFDNY